MVSFSTMTKNELSKLDIENTNFARAELAAIIQISSYLSINGDGKLDIEMGTENASIARRIYNLLKLVYDYQGEILVRKNKNLKRTNKYVIKISDSQIALDILIDIGLLKNREELIFDMENRILGEFKEDFETVRSYLRGIFLGGGSLSNPEKMYHLEFVTNDDQFAYDILEILNRYDLNAKFIERKESFIIYIKEGEKVVDFLNIIGAHNALLKLEDIRIVKEMRNNVNRLVNCETANLAKTVDASMRQVANIQYIKDTIGLDNLPDNLKETAILRLRYEELSLKELGEKHNPKVGKSGVNHRLRKLEELAMEIKDSKK